MIKLIAVEQCGASRLRLRFSDGTAGIYDFSRFVTAATAMTLPLAEPDFFARYFIDAGALAWPNGFDLSAASLHHELRERGELRPDAGTG